MADEADFTVRLIDQITRPARNAARALQGIDTAGTRLARRGAASGGVGSFVGNLGKGLGKIAGGAMVAVRAIAGVGLGAAALGGAAAFGIAKLGSSAEQSQNQVAGFLTALDIAPDFTTGLQKADDVIRKIKLDSAALPGEAEDYIQVFKTGLPVLQGALGKNLSDITAFSNKFTAITNTLGIDAEQAGRDLARMLQVGRGGAGLDVRSFTELLPFLRKVEGQANLTAESFNRMTQPQRAEVLTKAMAQLDPMLQNAAGSFDAMFGALKTSGAEILRLASAPLFEAMKSALGKVNEALMNADGTLTPFAQKFVDVGKQVAAFLVPALGAAWDLIKGFAKSFSAAFDGADFKAGFEEILNVLKSPDTMQAIQDFGTFVGHAATAVGTLFKWVSMLVQPLLQVMGAGTAMYNAVFEAFSGLGTLADSIMMGLINGIRSFIPSLVASMRESAMAGLAAFKGVFGIASPSTEMMAIGQYLGAGLQIGTEATAPAIAGSAAVIGAAATSGAMDGGQSGGGAAGGSPIHATFNVYQQPDEDGERFSRRVFELFEEQFT